MPRSRKSWSSTSRALANYARRDRPNSRSTVHIEARDDRSSALLTACLRSRVWSIATWLMFGATILGGLLAGGNFDRLAIQMPAWRGLAPRAWAEYSRRADLRNGIVVYPIE